jgi:hypothetical protein
VKSGPDVFADALVPAARAFGAGALICQFLLNRFSGRSALTSPDHIDPMRSVPGSAIVLAQTSGVTLQLRLRLARRACRHVCAQWLSLCETPG